MGDLDCSITGFSEDRKMGHCMPCKWDEIKSLLPEFLEYDWIVILVGSELVVNTQSGYAMELFSEWLDFRLEEVSNIW